ncbi:N-acetylglucosamine kinase [Nesterenkonia xinjiangensis]|uniref:N-acetylglucosamine kinase-like BadF-type ATPase n=2 Tax=Nesterenkonia xinjiangensis TaxID=225327 RepID=A0A7Z0GMB8_9MICC|nr:BadF/BadG/BcrA/BcrD ATPase family protein [Nesterenkonia xinjiangensis]NYJ78611.1 N-acetylglucosamine kinase-like BadF-type ATPase [Nesterenkonia xinjiangensis]
MAARPLIAMDVGQTSTKAILCDSAGERREVLDGVQTDQPVLPQLRSLVAQTLADLGQDAVVALGVSGLTGPDSQAEHLLDPPGTLRPLEIHLAHDSVTAGLSALGRSRGAVMAAGTGAVALGVGQRSVARVDGWGNVMGDAGSAYWIGRSALDAVMRAHDGRGPQTTFTAAAVRRWPDIESAYLQLQNDADRVSTVAAFAREVSRHADTDPVCAEICRRAGRELAHTVLTALRRVGEPRGGEPTLVASTGGVFGSSHVREEFSAHLHRSLPQVRLLDSEAEGVDGAAHMAQLPEDHPLRPLISSAAPKECLR